jgi:hypothetical protein
MKLLWGDEGPPCPSRSPCLSCRTSPPTTDGVCGWVLWLTTKAGRYAKEAEVSKVNAYRTQPECDVVLAQTLTEQGKLDNRTVSKEYGEVITWFGKRGTGQRRYRSGSVSPTSWTLAARRRSERHRRPPLAPLAPHQPRPARDAAHALERGGVGSGPRRVQGGGRAAERDPARGVVFN